VLFALKAVELGRIEDARAAMAEARRLQPDPSLEFVRHTLGVSRPRSMRVERGPAEAGPE
jgi:hypothetical protein